MAVTASLSRGVPAEARVGRSQPSGDPHDATGVATQAQVAPTQTQVVATQAKVNATWLLLGCSEAKDATNEARVAAGKASSLRSETLDAMT